MSAGDPNEAVEMESGVERQVRTDLLEFTLLKVVEGRAGKMQSMITPIIAILLVATPVLAGDEIWRSNGEEDVWVTTRNGTEVGFHCDGRAAHPVFTVTVTLPRTRVYVPAYMALSARNGATNLGPAIFSADTRVIDYQSGGEMTVTGLGLPRGRGGDAVRAMSRAEAIIIGIRESSGEWENIRLGTRGAREAFANSWCNEETYRRWRSAYDSNGSF